jgi:hypothetical protein
LVFGLRLQSGLEQQAMWLLLPGAVFPKVGASRHLQMC